MRRFGRKVPKKVYFIKSFNKYNKNEFFYGPYKSNPKGYAVGMGSTEIMEFELVQIIKNKNDT